MVIYSGIHPMLPGFSKVKNGFVLTLQFNSTSSNRTTKFAKDVVAIGHTSGWDTLAGLFLGLHLWLHKVGIATTSVLPSKLFTDASSWSRRVVESQ